MISPAPFVYVAVVEDDLVVLDLRHDAYFCLPDIAAQLVADDQGGWSTSSPDLARRLIETGLFEQGLTLRRSPALQAASHTSRTMDHGPFAAPATGRFLSVMAREAWRIRGRSLKTLIACSPDLPLDQDQTAQAIADARLFDFWMPWIPGQGQCLYRAYLLRALLATRGVGATWIFGVRTWPFSAHCWLQIGDLLLDDDLDRVALYTPILAVGA